MDDIIFTEISSPEEPVAPVNPVEQISHLQEDGSYALSLIAKRTYRVLRNGSCHPHEEQQPLQKEFEFYPHHSALLQADMDLYPLKPLTDIVIKGSAYAYNRENSTVAAVEVERQAPVSFRIFGDRKAYVDQSGHLAFSIAEPIENIPLRYDFAYGGIDRVAEEAFEFPEEYLKLLPEGSDPYSASPYRYPRNPAGKGYLINANTRALELTELPNIEDPDHLLSPNSLALGNTDNWFSCPLPRCTDWVNPLWFPRNAYFGMFIYPSQEALTLPEVNKGWAAPYICQARHISERVSYRAGNGASLGLQMDGMSGNERMVLRNMKAEMPAFQINLPGDEPRLWIDGRKGKLIEVTPHLFSVIIRPDEHLLEMVWGGTGAAIRPYFEHETEQMPYRIEWKMSQ